MEEESSERSGLPLSPQYVGFGKALGLYWKNIFNFSGRSTRSEFWWAYLWTIILSFLLGFMAALLGLTNSKGDKSTVEFAIQMIFFIPSLSLHIRRFHDTGRSGWNILWAFIPLFGAIYVLRIDCTASDVRNEWGPNADELEHYRRTPKKFYGAANESAPGAEGPWSHDGSDVIDLDSDSDALQDDIKSGRYLPGEDDPYGS